MLETQKAGREDAGRLMPFWKVRPGMAALTAQGSAYQYNRWRLVTSRELRRSWRFTAAAALRLRSWVGFS